MTTLKPENELKTAPEALRRAGWREQATDSPWRWYDLKLPAAHYRLEDAWAIVKGMR